MVESSIAPSEMEGEIQQKIPQPSIPYKFILLVLLCMTALSCNALTYSFTLTQFHSYGNGSAGDYYTMHDYQDIDERITNITYVRRRFLSNPEKETLIAVIPIGALFAIIPAAMIYKTIGFSKTFISCGALSIVTSVVIPTVTNAQLFALAIIIRIIQGMSFGAFVPVIAKVGSYLSIEDFTINTVILFSYLQLSGLLTFFFAGFLAASSLGWHSVHYAFCIASAILFVAFFWYHSSERFQRTMRQGRLFEVFYGTMAEHRSSSILTFHLPYLSIYQDLPIWSIFMGAFGYFSGVQLALQYVPLFLVKITLHSTIGAGLISSTPLLAILLLNYCTALNYPKIPFTSENKLLRIRIFNTISSLIPGVVFILIACFDPVSQQGIVTVLYIIGASFLGFAGGGFFAAIKHRAGPYSVFIVANIHAICFVSKFLVSLLNVMISRNEEYNEWRPLFVVLGSVMIVCNILFCIFATTEQAEWTKEGYQDTSFDPRRGDVLPQRPL